MNNGGDQKSADQVKQVIRPLYKLYHGHIIATGELLEDAIYRSKNDYHANIGHLTFLKNPLNYAAFKHFQKISQFSSTTYLTDQTYDKIAQLIINDNAEQFPHSLIKPQTEEKQEQEIQSIPPQQLKKLVLAHSRKPTVKTITTTTYQRDPYIAYYAKITANGHCQLCGQPAPFTDQYGKPYLECHHVKWLSRGGKDDKNNVVALCPNCHRKMHIVDDANDIHKLEIIIKNREKSQK